MRNSVHEPVDCIGADLQHLSLHVVKTKPFMLPSSAFCAAQFLVCNLSLMITILKVSDLYHTMQSVSNTCFEEAALFFLCVCVLKSCGLALKECAGRN